MVPSRTQVRLVKAAAVLAALVLAGIVVALYIVPFLVYGAYVCVRPAPVLEVEFASEPHAEALDHLIGVDYDELEATHSRTARYRIQFDRGDADVRDAAARRLRGADGVVSVRLSEERCD
jgi:hypothetical protein